MPQEPIRERQREGERERAEDDRATRNMDVGHESMVAGNPSHGCANSVPKGHTEDVLPFFSALALVFGSLHGTVTRGPITPVCRVGTPCDGPAAHTALFFKGLGKTWTCSTDAKGRYRIVLQPGTYSVRTNQKPFGRMTKPSTVRVVANKDRVVNLFIDTGIR